MPPRGRKVNPTNSDPYAATSWGGEITIDLDLPSGQKVLLRRPGVQGLIAAGLFESLDALSSIVQTEHIDRVEEKILPPSKRSKTARVPKPAAPSGVDPAALRALAEDPARIMAAMDLVDKVVAYVVIRPAVTMAPEGEPGKVPINAIGIMDKLFIMQFVMGGSADLARFREEHERVVDSMENVADFPL